MRRLTQCAAPENSILVLLHSSSASLLFADHDWRDTVQDQPVLLHFPQSSGAVLVRPAEMYDTRRVTRSETRNRSIGKAAPFRIVRIENMTFSGREHRNDSEQMTAKDKTRGMNSLHLVERPRLSSCDRGRERPSSQKHQVACCPRVSSETETPIRRVQTRRRIGRKAGISPSTSCPAQIDARRPRRAAQYRKTLTICRLVGLGLSQTRNCSTTVRRAGESKRLP
jgi:hypothetical protein